MYIYASTSLNFDSHELNEGGKNEEYLSEFEKKRKGNKEFNMASNGENRNIPVDSNGENRNIPVDSNGGNRNIPVDSNGGNRNGVVDRRLEAIRPPVLMLGRNVILGGHIFVCNNEIMEENLRRQMFGLPDRHIGTVESITPGMPLFLYNYETHQLHGIFEATSFGGTNIDPLAWPDNNNPGSSRFPSQVRVRRRMICEPLDDFTFRIFVHHYPGNRFRPELTGPEAMELLAVFDGRNR